MQIEGLGEGYQEIVMVVLYEKIILKERITMLGVRD
jgi:hypothetical protein